MVEQHREFEAKLIIQSAQSSARQEKIRSLRQFGGYPLHYKDQFKIRDTYFEHPDQLLRRADMALRLRHTSGDLYITLKGKLETSSWGGVDRLEIEEKWSKAALKKILNVLQDHHIPIRFPDDNLPFDDAGFILKAMDFELIQDRQTERKRYEAFDSSRPVAEVAFDMVIYEEQNRKFFHHEIEIEALPGGKVHDIQQMVVYLTREFEDELRIWTYSKLETGLALSQLLSESGEDLLADSDGHLLKSAYDKIELKLKSPPQP